MAIPGTTRAVRPPSVTRKSKLALSRKVWARGISCKLLLVLRPYGLHPELSDPLLYPLRELALLQQRAERALRLLQHELHLANPVTHMFHDGFLLSEHLQIDPDIIE